MPSLARRNQQDFKFRLRLEGLAGLVAVDGDLLGAGLHLHRLGQQILPLGSPSTNSVHFSTMRVSYTAPFGVRRYADADRDPLVHGDLARSFDVPS